jgi:hypothetical protein
MSGLLIKQLLTFIIIIYNTSNLLYFIARIHDVEEKYYADGENAYNMRKYFVDKNLVADNNNNL